MGLLGIVLFNQQSTKGPMGRQRSFIDREFWGCNWGASDSGDFQAGLVGVAMPFKGDKWDAVDKVIRDECSRLDLRALRVDEYIASGVVLRDIAKITEDAEFLIFELSAERPDVYYELGYAHGIGNEANDILLIAEVGTTLHYDIAGLRVHFYRSLEHLRELLKKGLADMIWRSR